MDRLRKGRLINPDGCSVALTFGEFTEGFFDEGSDYLAFQAMRGRELRGNTLKAYSRSLDALREEFSKARLEAISPDMVQRFLFRKKADGLSASSCNMFLTVMSVVMDHAYARCAIDDNPCARVKRIASSGARREAFTADEVVRLLSHEGDSKYGLMFRLMAVTGMRVGEAIVLRPEDLSEHAVTIRHNWNGECLTTPKNGKERQTALPDGLYGKLLSTSGKAFVFEGRGGRPIPRITVEVRLRKDCEALGIKGRTCHSLRHFYNTAVLSSGKLPETTVRAMIGHASEAMSDRYYHVTDEDVRKVGEIFKGL